MGVYLGMGVFFGLKVLTCRVAHGRIYGHGRYFGMGIITGEYGIWQYIVLYVVPVSLCYVCSHSSGVKVDAF